MLETWKKGFLLLALTACLSGCFGGGSGPHYYYWRNERVGGNRFVKDHNDCLDVADYFPYEFYFEMPYPWPLIRRVSASGKYKLSNQEKSIRIADPNAIWAYFEPYNGAQGVYVNEKFPSSSRLAWRYASCMRWRGYAEKEEYADYVGPEEEYKKQKEDMYQYEDYEAW